MDYTPNDPLIPPPAAAAPVAPPAAVAGGLSENAAAALSYVTIIPAIIFLLIEPYNKMPLVRFHSIQCLAFAVVLFAVHMVLRVIPIIGLLISLLISLGALVLWIICILKASKGEYYKLPLIGDFALNQSRTI